MTATMDSVPDTGIQRFEFVWSQREQRSQGQQQEHCLMEMVDLAKTGVIVDCSRVGYANRDLVQLLMRVRRYTKQRGKHMALCNVSRELRNVIGLANVRLALPAFKNSNAAEKLILKLASCQIQV